MGIFVVTNGCIFLPIKSGPSPETVVSSPAVPVRELTHAGTEKIFDEAHPPPEASLSVPQSNISSADDELVTVVTVEGKTSSASSLTAESSLQLLSLKPSAELQTPAGDHSLTKT